MVDGALPDDMRRGGVLQLAADVHELRLGGDAGRDAQAVILDRAGYAAFAWNDRALLRAAGFLYDRAIWLPSGDDRWQPWVLNHVYGMTWSAASPAQPARTWASPTGCTPARPGTAPIRQPQRPRRPRSRPGAPRSMSRDRLHRAAHGALARIGPVVRPSVATVAPCHPDRQPPGDPPVNRFEPNLRIPGPTALPPSVRAAGARQMINHRGPEFAAMLDRILTRMKPYFGTTDDVALLSCAGTGGLEAAVVNVLSPGDRVLAVSIGAFGDRFAKIATTYGADVTKLAVEWGQAADPAEVRAALAAEPAPGYRAVLLTHNETSTGVMNPIPALAAAIREVDDNALVLVDSVSGARAPSRSRWMPGASTSSSPARRRPGWPPRAWRWSPPRTGPGRRWRRRRCRASTSTSTPTATRTPRARPRGRRRSPSSTRSTRASSSWSARARRRSSPATRPAPRRRGPGLAALGFELFADQRFASRTVTAARLPEGLDWKAFNDGVKRRGVILAGGQGKLAGHIFRLGHLGSVTLAEILDAIGVIEEVSLEHDRPVEPGAARRRRPAGGPRGDGSDLGPAVGA